MSQRLPIRDDVYLLAHDEDGKPLVHSSMLGLGLAAGLLIDLALDGRIDAGSGRVVTRPRSGAGPAGAADGFDLASRALAELAAERREPPRITDVILTWQPGMYERVQGELVAADILHSVRVRRLGLMSTTRYRLVEEGTGVRIRTALRRAVNGQVPPTAGDAALCGLVLELQLERVLHAARDAPEIRRALRDIANRHHPAVRRILDATADAIRYRSTATSL